MENASPYINWFRICFVFAKKQLVVLAFHKLRFAEPKGFVEITRGFRETYVPTYVRKNFFLKKQSTTDIFTCRMFLILFLLVCRLTYFTDNY